MKLRFWCKNNSKCAIWICQWIITCGCYARTLSNTHAKADQHYAVLNDRFVDHME